jgi:hypothetical protein
MIIVLNDETLQVPEFKKAPGCKMNCSGVNTNSIRVEFESSREKAVAFRRPRRIRMDPGFWESITAEARAAVLGHEIAHVLGADCHRCADYYAGRFIRSLGNDPINSMIEIKRFIKRKDYSDFERGLQWQLI